jgi:hypothetical protein
MQALVPVDLRVSVEDLPQDLLTWPAWRSTQLQVTLTLDMRLRDLPSTLLINSYGSFPGTASRTY